ncbi:Glycoprotein 3-alpha-L-fucosyltransferase A [Holothuria leucospilota]|uniref:Fucosyltransferase n=1 Tax=Holothuria leucospilota TaxID=206669 RepID=A0A9Q1HHR9_HOLLE|nr:Glycoprotein 3-alpha-L-fucosyltransferase A [Holothuria leucospilota]
MSTRDSIPFLTYIFRLLAILSVLTTLVFIVCCIYLQMNVQTIKHSPRIESSIFEDYSYYENLQIPSLEENRAQIISLIRLLVYGFEFYWSRDSLKEERDVLCPEINTTVKVKFSSDHRAIYHADITFFSHLLRLGKMRTWKDHLDRRRKRQRWALFSLEPPIRSARNTTVHWGWRYRTYHWTATYNAESDIPFPYGKFVKDSSYQNESTELYNSKPKLLAFLSSNCNMTKWPRLRFVQTLQKYVPIDMYGKCGTIPCDWQRGCENDLKQYKFFLALENSQCEGYITEKFWNSLSRYKSVPIVWGARQHDYELVAPSHSYIHVSQFKSIKQLARRINQIGSNEVEYNSYHIWRKSGHIELLSDWSTLPSDGHVCAAAKRYQEDMIKLAKTNKTSFRDVNGKDWLESCKVGKDQVERKLPIPEIQGQ